LGNSAGRRIIQYFDSSAGIVQPTRIVCCAQAEPAPASVDTAKVVATIHFEDIRIIPRSTVPKTNFAFCRSQKRFMVQTIRQAAAGADKAQRSARGFAIEALPRPATQLGFAIRNH
jgi:hypothetical protein